MTLPTPRNGECLDYLIWGGAGYTSLPRNQIMPCPGVLYLQQPRAITCLDSSTLL